MTSNRTRGMLCAALVLFAAAPLRAQPATAGYPVSATHLAGEFRPSARVAVVE